jgi:hypothetical protein
MKSSFHSSTANSSELLIHNTQLVWDPRYKTSGRIQQETPFSNSPFIFACIFVAAGTRLPSRYITMNVYSGSTIPAFRRHSTMYFLFKA